MVKPWAARAFVAGLAILVTLVLVELVLRLTGAFSPIAYYLPRPGPLRDVQSDYDLTYHVDPSGIREKAPGPPLPPGSRPLRIVLIGDSFTFGQGVAAEDAMPSLLERALREAGLPADVVSVSAIGAGVVEYQALLRYRALALRPALVVVNVYGNDAADELAPTRRQVLLRAAALHSHLVTLLRTANRSRLLRENVRLSRDLGAFWDTLERACRGHAQAAACAQRVTAFRARAGNRVNNLAAACLRDPEGVRRFVETDPGGGGWRGFHEAIGDMRRRCAAAGVPMVLGVVPEAAQVDPGHVALLRELGVTFREDPLRGPGPFQTLVEALGRELGVPVYSPLAAFRAAPAGTYYPDDLHWSPAGHRLYTAGLASVVLQVLGRP